MFLCSCLHPEALHSDGSTVTMSQSVFVCQQHLLQLGNFTMQRSRRQFLKAGAFGIAAASSLASLRSVHAAENNVLKVGLVGCGGRGRGAVSNALTADPNARLVAVCDAFPDIAAVAVRGFKGSQDFGDRIDVTPETTFDGLDAYKKVIDLCDVVLLCEVPHFRPMSLRYAVEKGKHIFCEKPIAVDAPGVHSVLESAKIAQEKKLQLVSGLCWRYDHNVNGMMKRVQDGAIGDLLSVRETYLTGKIWTRPRREGDTEMMFQLRNWYNFTWLSGDYNVEQHVHSLDKALWAFGDKPPTSAFGVGGRMQRTEQPDYGNIYDSMGVVYEYEDGRTIYAFCRQQNNCFNDVDDYFLGTKGQATILRGIINGEEIPKVKSNMYLQEHQALFGAIRSGGETYINNGEFMAHSTMLGILGRMVCYNGKRMTWDEAINSAETLAPSGYTWDAQPPTLPDENGRYKVEIPGMGPVYHQVVR